MPSVLSLTTWTQSATRWDAFGFYWLIVTILTVLLLHHCLILWIVTKLNTEKKSFLDFFGKWIAGDTHKKPHRKDSGQSNPLCVPGSGLPQDLPQCPKVRGVQSPVCLLSFTVKPLIVESAALSRHTFQDGDFCVCRPREQNPVQLWCQHSERAGVESVSGQSSVAANQHLLQFDTLKDASCLFVSPGANGNKRNRCVDRPL